ncbi:MAG: hypothetical protein WKF78_11425 [Candidatus Limnocylindrales bacterium]
MNHYYTLLALDTARERALEARLADRARLAAGPERVSLIRRALAHGLAAISRGSAALARGSAAVAQRLDDSANDEFGRSFATK